MLEMLTAVPCSPNGSGTVILEKDPHEVPPETIKDIKVVRTVLGGRTTFPA